MRETSRTTSRDLALLGGWTLVVDGDTVALGGREQRLCALLALTGTRARAQVAGILWPDSTDTRALASLRRAVAQTHQRCPGLLAADRTSIGLVFAKPPIGHRIQQYEIWNNTFAIPPGDPNHRVTSCYTLDRDVLALAYTGHMHYRGKSIRTEAFFPDGSRDVLFSVPHYDFRWQETYMLKAPRLLPKGTRLVSTAYFDNSANNPLNPDASKQIRWGEPSDEEMMGFWLSFTDAGPNNPDAGSSASSR